MRIAFRADASLVIGTGHVMRCLTLANALHQQGAECTFVCRAHEGNLQAKIAEAGHCVHMLPLPQLQHRPVASDEYADWLGCSWKVDAAQTKDALIGAYDWLVVDHYALDARWESALRDHTSKIMVIDDLANRPHDCDLLLDQNLGRVAADYASLVNPGTTCLTGPKYALLRPEFAALRAYSLARRQRPRLENLLISMGGIDKDNVTGQVLDILRECKLPPKCRITVVLGEHAPFIDDVQKKAALYESRCQVKINVKNMAEIIANSDLGIGAAGSTAWERCCLGLPTLVLILANNQIDTAKLLKEENISTLVESMNDFTRVLKKYIDDNFETKEYFSRMIEKISSVTDGAGCNSIVNRLLR